MASEALAITAEEFRKCRKCGRSQPEATFEIYKPTGGLRWTCVDCYVPVKWTRRALDKESPSNLAPAEELCLETEPIARLVASDVERAATCLRALRVIATGRLDGCSGPPMLGPDGLREVARTALAAVEPEASV